MARPFLKLENRHTGEVLRLCRVREASGKLYLTIDGTLPAGSAGPPAHIHYVENEEGVVRAGTLGAQVGGKKMLVRVGERADLPAGIVHTWWNAGDDLLDFGGRVTPLADLDKYLQGVFAIVNAGPPGRPSLFYIAHLFWRYRKTQEVVNPPRIVQRILFPVVIGVGHVLGKYRGDDWPGSPASCPGAPEVMEEYGAA